MTWLQRWWFVFVVLIPTALVCSFSSISIGRLKSPVTTRKNTNNYNYDCCSQLFCHIGRLHEHTSKITSRQRTSLDAKTNEFFGDEENYLVEDSLELVNRPSVRETLMNPRDILSLSLVGVGMCVSISNIFGVYTENVYVPLESISTSLGIASVFASLLQIITGYNVVLDTNRRGLVNDLYLNLYAAAYALAVSWLALRTSNIAVPGIQIQSYDGILPWIMATIFFLSGITPAMTLWNPFGIYSQTPELSETEKVRARGLVAIGVLACVFLPDCLAFGLDSIRPNSNGDWWSRISNMYPSQPILESSTALFALYANEASMILHRLAKSGARTFRFIVPTGVVLCLILAILPCIAALYWLGNDISFFSFYTD